MKFEIYRCDSCNEILSDPAENIAEKHISIIINNPSGWVEKKQSWKFTGVIFNGVYHFCNEKCLAKKFKKLKDEKN